MAEDIRHRLKQLPTDVWSTREKLALASSVMRSGDQNWVSVSRAIRPFGNPGRPDDWFSQKNCALQYSALLEKVETPRRKRGERDVADTPGDVIVRKLTIERIEELKRTIQDEKNKYRSLKKDLETVQSGQMDHQIKDMYERMQADKKAAEEEAARKAAEERFAREQAKAALLRLKKPLLGNLSTQKKQLLVSDHEDSTQDSMFDEDTQDGNMSSTSVATPAGTSSRPLDSSVPGATPTPSSPLLSQLLSNPSKLFDNPQVVKSIPARNAAESSDVTVSTPLTGDGVVVKEEVVNTSLPASTAASTTTDSGIILLTPDLQTAEGSGPTPDDLSLEPYLKHEKDVKQEQLELLESNPSVTANKFQLVDVPGIDGSEEICSTSTSPIDKNSAAGTTPETADGAEAVAASERRTSTAAADDSKLDEQKLAEDERPPASRVVPEDTESEFPGSPASSVMSTDLLPVTTRQTPASRSNRGGRRKNASSRQSRAQQLEERSERTEGSSKHSEVETSEDDASVIHGGQDESTSDVFGSAMRRKIDLNESLPNSPASFTHSDTEDEKAHKIWKKSIMLVWRSIANHKNASVFMHRVNKDIAPGYHSIVHRPMDLTMIKKNIDSGAIRTTAEFQRDMMLMLINAMMFNHAEHDVHMMAMTMFTDVMSHIEHFVNTQMMVQSEPKLLRTLRRSDAHSDKEDETRKRKISEPELQPPVVAAAASGGKVKKRR